MEGGGGSIIERKTSMNLFISKVELYKLTTVFVNKSDLYMLRKQNYMNPRLRTY